MDVTISIDDFQLESLLSHGSFSDVHIGFRKDNPQKKFAIKLIKKENYIHKNLFFQISAEKDALAMSKSPLIVSIFYSLQNEDYVFLVMEYVEGSIDFQKLLDTKGNLDLKSSIFYTAQVLMALEYIHNHSIIHRDLKLSNILLTKNDHIKLIDFGLSHVDIDRNIDEHDILLTPTRKSQNIVVRTPRQIKSLIQPIKCKIIKNLNKDNTITLKKTSKQSKQFIDALDDKKDSDTNILNTGSRFDSHSERGSIKKRILGTAYYMAPEIINKIENQDGRVDIWALGVCFYQMVTTFAPFMADDINELFRMIVNDPFKWQPNDLNVFDASSMKFVEDCLIKDCKRRPSAMMLKVHDLFRKLNFESLWNEIKQYN